MKYCQKFLLFIFFLLFFAFNTSAQSTSFSCLVENQTVSGDEFSFDIFIKNTGTDEIYLGESDLILNFDQNSFTSPALLRRTDLVAYDVIPVIKEENNLIINIGAPSPYDQYDLGPRCVEISKTGLGTKIVTIILKGIANSTGSANLQWQLAGDFRQIISTFDNNLSQHEITEAATFVEPTAAPLPVELSAFNAYLQKDNVLLNWTTATEINNYGFDVERKEINDNDWLKLAFIKGSGNSNSVKQYSYRDNKISNGKYYYRLKQIDSDGKYEFSKTIEVEANNTPSNFELMQNYPNPFNPDTHIKFTVPEKTFINISIYNTLGEKVSEVVNDIYETGTYEKIFRANNLSSGTYLAVLKSGSRILTQKMTLLK